MQRNLFPAALLLISGLFLLPPLSFAQKGGDEEWGKLLGAAKKEGKVVVSIPASAELRKGMEEAFKKRFPGIDLELVAARGSNHTTRMAEEARAGVRYFDLHVGGTNSIVTGLLPEGVLEPILPFMILQEVKEPKKWWGGHIWADKARQYIYMFQAYITETMWQNTDLVKPGEIASYDDLLRPKWKGKIVILDPRTPGSGDSTWAFLWAIKGEDYLRKLVGQELIVGQNQRQLAESVAKGKAALSIGLSYYVYQPFVKAGLPLKSVPTPKEGSYASSGSGNLVILKNAPHPAATRVFVNWLLSKEGQEIFGKTLGQPTRRLDVDTSWTAEFGHVSVKNLITPERFYELENQSEDKVEKVRKPAAALASKLLD
jgi:iron(III) transport system substrate-binding protein